MDRITEYFEVYNNRNSTRFPKETYDRLSMLWLSFSDEERAKVNDIMNNTIGYN